MESILPIKEYNLYHVPQIGKWSLPDPAEQFHNPYLAMGNNPVMYVDPDGEFVFEAITLATVVITASSAAATTIAIAAGVTLAATATAIALSATSASSAAAASAAAVPPDGYLYDPNNPNQLQWQSFEGRSEGLDYITNSQTGDVITRPMHTNFAEINPTSDLPGRFASLSDPSPMRITYPLDRLALRPASYLSLSNNTATLQSGIASLGSTSGLGASVGGFNPLGLIGAGAGGWAAAGALSYYNPKTSRWWSTSQQRYYNGNNFTGNQWTNNGMRGARGISNAFKWGGRGLGAWNAFNVADSYYANEINTSQFVMEQGSNAISTLASGLYGAAWGLGWELGRSITTIPGYHSYIRVPARRLFSVYP